MGGCGFCSTAYKKVSDKKYILEAEDSIHNAKIETI